MNKGKRALIAMSGGVDSSVGAALLVMQGYEVIGITFKLFCYAKTKLQKKACCSLEAINDAKAVCRKLGIKHYVVDCSGKFEKDIINNFIHEYLSGRTPNPCVRCNQLIKFDFLFRKAHELKADYVATGHYARLASCFGLRARGYQLLSAKDKDKDQSYFLYTLTQGQLRHLLFPVGEYTKSEVRGIAKKAGLKIYNKAESQEICFIETDYRDFLQKKLGKKIKPGFIITVDGRNIGKHQGLPFYTIGQRKGIGVGGEKPFYVVSFDSKNNTLIVSDKEKDLFSKGLIAQNVNWVSEIEQDLPLEVRAKIRYRHNGAEAIVERFGKNYKVKFTKPQRAITPGQSVVFYKGGEVIGGGVIKEGGVERIERSEIRAKRME